MEPKTTRGHGRKASQKRSPLKLPYEVQDKGKGSAMSATRRSGYESAWTGKKTKKSGVHGREEVSTVTEFSSWTFSLLNVNRNQIVSKKSHSWDVRNFGRNYRGKCRNAAVGTVQN